MPHMSRHATDATTPRHNLCKHCAPAGLHSATLALNWRTINPLCSVALQKLGAMEQAYAALAAATRFKGSQLSQDVLALDHLLSLLFPACTRVGRDGIA